MKKSVKALFIAPLLCVLCLSACMSSGLTVSTHQTDVELSNNNYKLIATNVSGEYSCEGILGLSAGIGLGASQFAILPLTSERDLYRKAMQNLWANFEAKNGSPINRPLALVNYRYDAEILNTFFYTKIKLILVADVVEFN